MASPMLDWCWDPSGYTCETLTSSLDFKASIPSSTLKQSDLAYLPFNAFDFPHFRDEIQEHGTMSILQKG